MKKTLSTLIIAVASAVTSANVQADDLLTVYQQALQNTLRQAPDVILIGEMRDRVTVETALKAAQTGRLMVKNWHLRKGIKRILEIFG